MPFHDRTFLAPSVALVTAIITTLAVGGLLAGVSPTFLALDARFWPPLASLMRLLAGALSYPRWARRTFDERSRDHCMPPLHVTQLLVWHEDLTVA